MKLQFDPALPYQAEAIEAVAGLFEGQEIRPSRFTISYQDYDNYGTAVTAEGVTNHISLEPQEIEANMRHIQLANGLPQTRLASPSDYNFDIEMETGTGKTYVYLKTILELRRRYGFAKFIIVVPSLAIKEGVYKSLEITEEHFRGIFENETYDYFIYDSNKLEQVRSFAMAEHVSIMVINIDAFRKSFTHPDQEKRANIIHRTNDRLSGTKPIDLIRSCHPFVIIDEPQSVDNTPKAREAIAGLNPAAIFRYSATHVQRHHTIYKLDAVDAFHMGLVKQIQVTSFDTQDDHNAAYIRLISTTNKGGISARIEIDRQTRQGAARRQIIKVKAGDDLYELSGERSVYEGYILGEISCAKGNEYIAFTNTPHPLSKGDTLGSIEPHEAKKQQIRATIQTHLENELRLHSRGVKVLSLFFIDRVANYRSYDDQGNEVKGPYAQMFEALYAEEIRRDKYRTLFEDVDTKELPQAVHNGYFSADKKGVLRDTAGSTQADDDAYRLIMRDKERLLSLDCPLRFIFSHSALREGWDNPNVFQICTLNDTQSEIKKRQEIGRGLRLCVNQDGERLYGNDVNTLTVIANESYEDFCQKLQQEYQEDCYIRFGYIAAHTFANIPIEQECAPEMQAPLGQALSESIFEHFVGQGYLHKDGAVQDTLREALRDNSLSLPEVVESVREEIAARCRKAAADLPVRKTSERKKVELNKQRFLSEEFKALWEQIKYKTTYSVDFTTDDLIATCSQRLRNDLHASEARMVQTTVSLHIGHAAVSSEVTRQQAVSSDHLSSPPLPNVVDYLQTRTNLKRSTIAAILTQSNTLHLFIRNPQRYMEEAHKLIVMAMRQLIVDGIKYKRIGSNEYYTQELFEEKELYGYLGKNMIVSERSVYDHVLFDSANEERFAKAFEQNDNVKVFAKLPSWFKIPTPLGSYNPDWAVLIEEDGKEKLYLVIETKANLLLESLRPTERAKIDCGHKHFEAIGTEAKFVESDDTRRLFINAYDDSATS